MQILCQFYKSISVLYYFTIYNINNISNVIDNSTRRKVMYM